MWVDFKDVATDPYLGHILDLLDGLFGGYCSMAEATAALPVALTQMGLVGQADRRAGGAGLCGRACDCHRVGLGGDPAGGSDLAA